MDISGIKTNVDQQPVSVEPVKSPALEKLSGSQETKQTPAQAQRDNFEKNEEILEEAVDKLNKTAVIFDRSIRFQVHEKTHRTMVSVVDIINDKVIRQIPHEEVLDLVSKMDDYLGMIFDKKA